MSESYRIEYKKTITEALEKEVVAFLNSRDGGIVYIGVDRIEITSTGGLSTIKNIEEFFDGYSKPNSREIMRIYKDLELVEHLGSGLERILSFYTKESFSIKENYMRNIFYKNKTQIKTNVGVSVGVSEVLEFIKTHQPIKANVIADNFPDVTQRTIERYIKQLRDEEKIEFKGAPKTGGYVVI